MLPGPPWLLTWLVQIAKQQRATVQQIRKMNKWHMALHQSLCNISILIQASNPAPIITSLNAFTCDVETAINGGYDCSQEIWLQELQVLIMRVEHTMVECMLLVEDRLPDHDDLIIIRNLPSTLG